MNVISGRQADGLAVIDAIGEPDMPPLIIPSLVTSVPGRVTAHLIHSPASDDTKAKPSPGASYWNGLTPGYDGHFHLRTFFGASTMASGFALSTSA